MLLCFKREFVESDALRLWEACWARYQTDYFHLFVCAAVIAVYGEDVVQQDLPADEMLLHFSSLSMHMSGEVVLRKVGSCRLVFVLLSTEYQLLSLSSSSSSSVFNNWVVQGWVALRSCIQSQKLRIITIAVIHIGSIYPDFKCSILWVLSSVDLTLVGLFRSVLSRWACSVVLDIAQFRMIKVHCHPQMFSQKLKTAGFINNLATNIMQICCN